VKGSMPNGKDPLLGGARGGLMLRAEGSGLRAQGKICFVFLVSG